MAKSLTDKEVQDSAGFFHFLSDLSSTSFYKSFWETKMV